MSTTPAFDEMMQLEQFIELVAHGISPVNAGIEVSWSPAKTKRMLADPEIAEMLAAARDRADGLIEKALFDCAARGNVSAIQMWLYNRQPDQWRDVKRIEVRSEHKVTVAAVESVKVGVLELIREHGVGAMQALNSGITDAEIVDTDDL